MEKELTRGEKSSRLAWIRGPNARILLRNRHTLPILLYLNEAGESSVSDVIDGVKGSPRMVIRTLRLLEVLGMITTRESERGRRTKKNHLTILGLEFVETPMCDWPNMIRRLNNSATDDGRNFTK